MTSGPGAMSRRTDGGPASKQAQRYISGMPNYGDGQELSDLQASAPMAATPSAKPASPAQINQAVAQGGAGPQQSPMANVIPLTAPTQNPNEPVTAGAASGPGAGPSILGIMPGQPMGGTTAKQTIQTLAQHPDASPELKQLAAFLGQ
jgi:hypothetical protein